jgi:hypothetical protein
VYVPAARLWSSATTLGPRVLAIFVGPEYILRLSELHFEKESSACAAPWPTLTEKLRLPFLGFRDPEKVRVCVVAGGGGGTTGAAVTTAVAAETAVEEPALFDAVTPTRKVVPASTALGEYDGLVAPATSEHAPPEASQRLH